AFFVTQHLKSNTPLITGMSYPNAFSPNAGNCTPERRDTHISFYLLHRADDVDVYVADESDTIVRTIALNHHMRKGVRRPDGIFVWNGREDSGRLAPDGTYHFRVGLRNQGRTIDLTGYPIVLESVAARPRVTRIVNQLLPSGGQGATIHYTGAEGHNASVQIYRTDPNPAAPRLVASFVTAARSSTATWDGRIAGHPAPAAVYLMGLEVTDRACNTGRFPSLMPPIRGSTPHAGVTVRYLAAEPPQDPVPAGSRAVVYVDSRQHPYRWTLTRVGAGRPAAKGAGSAFKLLVPIPRGSAGLYTLALESGPHRTAVPIVVRSARTTGGGILVVLPALTWQAENPVDDDGDGMPNTLDTGGPVSLERVLANGLPAGFAGEAGLLAYLDRAHVPYDLTTDTGLISGSGPGLGGHSGVVLAGAERWLPSAQSAALRAYVQNGGQVHSLGIGSLLRGVTVQTGPQGAEAVNPGAPSSSDPFGARPGVLTPSSAETLVIRDDLGLFTGTSGALPGFRSYVSITPPSTASQVSSAGVTSAAASIVGYRLGRGIVVEIGLPGFGARIAGSLDVQELTRRIWTILSH
ncbi:MAG: N,N-dimethylformamidase beta subunit family domain-containing protein, partial [Solirubrobacteraceae bacterium]